MENAVSFRQRRSSGAIAWTSARLIIVCRCSVRHQDRSTGEPSRSPCREAQSTGQVWSIVTRQTVSPLHRWVHEFDGRVVPWNCSDPPLRERGPYGSLVDICDHRNPCGPCRACRSVENAALPAATGFVDVADGSRRKSTDAFLIAESMSLIDHDGSAPIGCLGQGSASCSRPSRRTTPDLSSEVVQRRVFHW